MAVQRFFARVAEEYSLSFSGLEDLYEENFYPYKNYDANFDCLEEFNHFLKRFEIKDVTYETVALFLEEFEKTHILKRKVFYLECAARNNKAIYSFLCGTINGICIVYFALKKGRYN